MISDSDRSGYFGASETAVIMGSWKTKTFAKFWATKLGLNSDHYTNRAMNAGQYYEHAVLEYIGAPRRDHQIIFPELLLRVNLDGDGLGRVWEVKTHSAAKGFKVTKAYWQQVQVQMYAKLRTEKVVPRAEIVAYGLEEGDYSNFFNDIDPARVKVYPIEYDPEFIQGYLKRLEYLAKCLWKGEWPDESDIH